MSFELETVEALGADLRCGATSALALVERALERAAEAEDLGIFLSLDAEAARSSARAADEAGAVQLPHDTDERG